jgi:hypothetical protein
MTEDTPADRHDQSRALCVACGLPIAAESAIVQVGKDRFAHPDCVNAPRREKAPLSKTTIRALAEIAARGQGGPI